MSSTPQQRARRRRLASLLAVIGIMGLFLATWAVPEGIIHWARATADEAPVPLSPRGWFAIISGPIALVVGGVLSIAAFQLARSSREPRTDEDRELDEQWGDEAMLDFDPTEFNRGHRSARLQERDRWS